MGRRRCVLHDFRDLDLDLALGARSAVTFAVSAGLAKCGVVLRPRFARSAIVPYGWLHEAIKCLERRKKMNALILIISV